jgi:hypothetical protein
MIGKIIEKNYKIPQTRIFITREISEWIFTKFAEFTPNEINVDWLAGIPPGRLNPTGWRLC